MIQEQLFEMAAPETPTTRVVHCKREQYDVYIGRKTRDMSGSIWGNPFQIGKDGTREEVIAKYRQYILSKPELLGQLESLRGKTLGCWCSPQACHGDVLVELLDSGMLPPEPPRPVQDEPLGQCIICSQPSQLKSPSGMHYCQKHGYCQRITCLKSVEKFVMHPRMGVYVCPCVLAFEREIEKLERSAS
jgi:hypothetical protein